MYAYLYYYVVWNVIYDKRKTINRQRKPKWQSRMGIPYTDNVGQTQNEDKQTES